MENSLRKLLKIFEGDPTVGSKVMDLLSRYSGLLVSSRDRRLSSWSSYSTVGSKVMDLLSRYSGLSVASPDRRLSSWSSDYMVYRLYRPTRGRRRGVAIARYFMENNLRKLMKTFECDLTVGSKVKDLLSRVCRWHRPTGGRCRGVAIPCYSMQNSLQKLINTFECNLMVGCKVMVLLCRTGVCRWHRPTGGRLRGVAIPRYSMEKSLRKLIKTFECNLTVRCKVTDLLSRYSGLSLASPYRMSSSWSSDSTLLHGKQPPETPYNI
ncbi:hypothetical protein D5086_031840 [Populus alba]|uniref:Uncharacterized protein n=1 Tax=Populus alba TaxID=43335 RepID=A0ACC4AJQ1_POPAL